MQNSGSSGELQAQRLHAHGQDGGGALRRKSSNSGDEGGSGKGMRVHKSAPDRDKNRAAQKAFRQRKKEQERAKEVAKRLPSFLCSFACMQLSLVGDVNVYDWVNHYRAQQRQPRRKWQTSNLAAATSFGIMGHVGRRCWQWCALQWEWVACRYMLRMYVSTAGAGGGAVSKAGGCAAGEGAAGAAEQSAAERTC